MTRPDLVDILARHVPAHKIQYSKKVLSLTQTSETATVRCSDYSFYQGDIVIGCDGAYSGIRQNIYRAIQAEYQEINVASLDNKRLNSVVKPLPKSDMAPLRFDQHAIVGVTGKLDADKYPFLREKACQSVTVFRGSLSVRFLYILVYIPAGCAFGLTLIRLVLFFLHSYPIHLSFGSSRWLMTALHGALAAVTFQNLNKTVNEAQEYHLPIALLLLQTIQSCKASSTLPASSVSLRGVLCHHRSSTLAVLCPKPPQ